MLRRAFYLRQFIIFMIFVLFSVVLNLHRLVPQLHFGRMSSPVGGTSLSLSLRSSAFLPSAHCPFFTFIFHWSYFFPNTQYIASDFPI